MPKIYKLSQINLNKKLYRREKMTERNIAKEKFKGLKSQTNRDRKVRRIHR